MLDADGDGSRGPSVNVAGGTAALTAVLLDNGPGVSAVRAAVIND